MRLIFLKYSARFCYLPVPRDNTLSRDNVAGVTKYIKVHVRSFPWKRKLVEIFELSLYRENDYKFSLTLMIVMSLYISQISY